MKNRSHLLTNQRAFSGLTLVKLAPSKFLPVRELGTHSIDFTLDIGSSGCVLVNMQKIHYGLTADAIE